jgi:hypothetical protein
MHSYTINNLWDNNVARLEEKSDFLITALTSTGMYTYEVYDDTSAYQNGRFIYFTPSNFKMPSILIIISNHINFNEFMTDSIMPDFPTIFIGTTDLDFAVIKSTLASSASYSILSAIRYHGLQHKVYKKYTNSPTYGKRNYQKLKGFSTCTFSTFSRRQRGISLYIYSNQDDNGVPINYGIDKLNVVNYTQSDQAGFSLYFSSSCRSDYNYNHNTINFNITAGYTGDKQYIFGVRTQRTDEFSSSEGCSYTNDDKVFCFYKNITDTDWTSGYLDSSDIYEFCMNHSIEAQPYLGKVFIQTSDFRHGGLEDTFRVDSPIFRPYYYFNALPINSGDTSTVVGNTYRMLSKYVGVDVNL